jgi:hypothetical protein
VLTCLCQVLSPSRHYDIRTNHPQIKAWLDRLHSRQGFYVSPSGSNDDWYWMYAAVQARDKGLLVRGGARGGGQCLLVLQMEVVGADGSVVKGLLFCNGHQDRNVENGKCPAGHLSV